MHQRTRKRIVSRARALVADLRRRYDAGDTSVAKADGPYDLVRNRLFLIEAHGSKEPLPSDYQDLAAICDQVDDGFGRFFS